MSETDLDTSAPAASPAPRRFVKVIPTVPDLTGLSRPASYALAQHPAFRSCFARIGKCLRVDPVALEQVLAAGGSSTPIRDRASRRTKAARTSGKA